jgi:hypothetical protein
MDIVFIIFYLSTSLVIGFISGFTLKRVLKYLKKRRIDQLRDLVRKLFIIAIVVYAVLIILYFSQILLFIILEVYEALPIIIPISIMYYCVVDTLTPNPKHSTVYGWFYAELLEHLFLPMTMILILTTIPAMFMLIFLFLIYYFYGHILGEIKTFKDVIKVCTLMVLVLILSFYPDLVFFVNVETTLGYVFILSTVIIVAIIYSVYHFRKLIVFSEDKSLAKAYLVLIASTIASSVVLNFAK